jgi:hypothetical protein
MASDNLARVVADASAPLQVETFVWSRGYRRVLADQTDHENHLTQGRRLADEVMAYRQAHPERRLAAAQQY